MFVPGIIISVVTFPGVIVHEIAHQIFCRILKVAVMDVCYFKMGNPAGYVIHETPQKLWHQLLIAIGPFIVNTIIGAIVTFPAVTNTYFFAMGTLDAVLMWLGISIAMHSFPSVGDAKNIWSATKKASYFIRVLSFPVVGIIYVGAIGSVIWLDLIYGYAVINFIPNLLAKALA